MKQILVIGGGMTFDNYNDYLLYLQNRTPKLEDKNRRRGQRLQDQLQGIATIKDIEMPSRRNAQYIEREIIFSNFLKIIDHKNTIVIGISLGGAFLVKYLSQHHLSDVHSFHLVCPAMSKVLPDEVLTNGFWTGPQAASSLTQYGSKLHFHFSTDDDVVPISERQHFESVLPDANYYQYDDKNGHFVISEFPEIVEAIKKSI